MIRKNILKWLAASAIAIAAVPAIGMAKHATHVSAAPTLSAVTTTVGASTKAKSVKPAVTKSKSTAKAAKSRSGKPKASKHRKHRKSRGKSVKGHKAAKSRKATKSTKPSHRAKKHTKRGAK